MLPEPEQIPDFNLQFPIVRVTRTTRTPMTWMQFIENWEDTEQEWQKRFCGSQRIHVRLRRWIKRRMNLI